MRTARQRLSLALAALLLAGATVNPAAAHPHVFAEARLDVTVGPDQTIQTLSHVWRFDDLFSSTVLVEFDANKDMKLDDAELEHVAATVKESLKEFGYFQMVTADGKDVKMQAPDRLMALFEGNQLTILFQSRPEQALALKGKLDFGVYDPTFYTAIDFTEDSHLEVEGLPATCTKSVVRPDADEALAANSGSLTDAFFNDPTGTDMSKIFATRLELACGASG